MARTVHSDGTTLVSGPSGAIVIVRLTPGVLYLIGLGNFDGPYEDGPMCDFDREIASHGSLDLFLDVRTVERGSRKSREPWKKWATENHDRHRSYIFVRSALLHMAISVIAMVSGTAAQSFSDEETFLAEVRRLVPGTSALPTIPAWVSTKLDAPWAARP